MQEDRKGQTSLLWRLGEATGDENSGVRRPKDGLLWSTKRKGLWEKPLSSPPSPSLERNSMSSEASERPELEVSKSIDLSSLLSDQTALLDLPVQGQEMAISLAEIPETLCSSTHTAIFTSFLCFSILEIFLRPTDESHLRISLTDTLTPSPSISRFLFRFRWVSLFNIDPNNPKPLLLFWVLGFEDAVPDCFWILRAASRRIAAVLAGMWRKIALEPPLHGLLAGDENSKSGDFLMSGESRKEKKQAFLQKFPGKFEASAMGFRFLTCKWVFGDGLFNWPRLSAI